MKIKVIKVGQDGINNISEFYVSGISDISDYRDKVVLHANKFNEIFGERKVFNYNKPWLKGVIKISFNSDTIYRIFKGSSKEKITKNQLGLTYESLSFLNIDNPQEKDFNIILEPASKIELMKFFKNHPDTYVRLYFCLGSISILLSIVSIILSII